MASSGKPGDAFFSVYDSFPIQVTGLPDHLGEKLGLGKICITIIHLRVSDLKVELQSPDGSSIWLTNRNGGATARDYYDACFRRNSFSGYIHQATPPFVNGEYIPDGRMGFLNSGQNPNGTWWLRISDLREGETRGSIFVRLKRKEMISKRRYVSYCLFDKGVFNNSDSLCIWQGQFFGEKNLPNYGFGHYVSCNAEQQGISVGGYDTYGML
ncbi:proprotein convertase P-domain-containing protein [Lewinella sp. LCG006]|uniref:proprotein convertase P-domain-containing protein n=1 Tax=Lewinella sp. LCG006 TaxID=3231911 RepID=UPI00345F53EB